MVPGRGLPVRVWVVELVVAGTVIVTIEQVIVIEAVLVVVIVMVALTATANINATSNNGNRALFPQQKPPDKADMKGYTN